MKKEHTTKKQEAFRWLMCELIEDYSRNADFSLTREFLAGFVGHDRHVVLRSLFWHALQSSDWTLADHCIDEGYPIVPGDRTDAGPLHSVNHHLADRPDVVEWLLQHGADIECRDWLGCTPLIDAVAHGLEGTVATLLRHGANINATATNDGNYTPLLLAAERGNESIVKVLLASGANPCWKTDEGKDAIDCAKEGGHPNIVRLLEREKAERRM